MTPNELEELIYQAKGYLQKNWYLLSPHKRDDLKYKIRLLKEKLRDLT